ncbi:MAG: sfuC1 [Pseudonocardiales bacterium]|nr:sfuC1 [Jatrophihabitantaceae bacterium]MCW2602379.1 sfuC1 [Pseudonocardiales bacterium]
MNDGAALEVRGISKSFGRLRVLDGIDLTIPGRTTTAILGPSGCGKTTLLRLVAGFERSDGGTISIAGRSVQGSGRSTPPNRRDVGYVAQEGALFPHLDVRANIGFGLARWPAGRKAKRSRVEQLIELVGLDRGHAARHPHELSGGQQQRVALARALARRPSLVLLDEPFSSLDASARVSTRTAVAAALREEGVTTLLVTHDQSEALALADQVAVMVAGRFRQVAPGPEIYLRPIDLECARLLGAGSTLQGRAAGDWVECALGRLPLADSAPFTSAAVFIRPEQVTVHSGTAAVVTAVDYLGADKLAAIRLPSGEVVEARLAGTAALAAGDQVDVRVEGTVLAFASLDALGAKANSG